LLATCDVAGTAVAQTYQMQPVRVVVAYGAGGGSDSLMRAIVPELSELLGQQVVIDNRPGAGTVLGTQLVATAKPDGYTIMIADNAFMVNPFLMAKLPYDSLKNFVPVVSLASDSQVLAVVHPSLPVKSIKDLVALARARPGELNYGSGGTGTYSFLAMELFKGQAVINMLHIPYKGGGAALNAILAGETQVYFAPVGVALSNIQERRMRALAVSTARRVSLTPDLPTLAEAGVVGYESGNWYGMVVPAKTPPAVVSVLRAAALSVLNNATTVKRMQDFGYVPVGNTADEFSAYIKLEIERLGKIVRAFKLQPD
jgi:tripartite-type tricarboxylate transporter receptor subunit TctC